MERNGQATKSLATGQVGGVSTVRDVLNGRDLCLRLTMAVLLT